MPAKHLEIEPALDHEAPYGRRADGQPKGRPGRKAINVKPMVPEAAQAGPPLRRNNPRPPPRPQPTRELAREPSRANATVTGRNGEVLTRSQSDMGGDIFERVKAPAGWTFQWNAITAINKELSEIQAGASVDMHANGWRPVPASRYPGVWTAPGYDGAIVVKGMRLEERPETLTHEARREDEMRAKSQIRDQTDALRLTQSKLPGANAGRAKQASGMRMTIDKTFEVPPDENYDMAEE